MKELSQRIQDLAEEVSGAVGVDEVREMAHRALAALADIAAMPETRLEAGVGAFDTDVTVKGLHKFVFAALGGYTPEEEFEAKLRQAIALSVSDVMNYPTDIGPQLLGRDLSAVVKKVTEKVLEVVSTEPARKSSSWEATEPAVPGVKRFRFVNAGGVPSQTLSETEALQRQHLESGHIEQWNPVRRVWEHLWTQKPPEFEFRLLFPNGPPSAVMSGPSALAMVKRSETSGGIVQSRVKGSGDAWVEVIR